MSPRIGVCVLLAATLALPARAGDPVVERLAGALLEAALGKARAEAPAPGRELFAQVLASEAFVGQSVGTLDVYVRVADGLRKPKDAQRTLGQAVEGLQPAADLLQARLAQPGSQAEGRRLAVVLCSSDIAKQQVAWSEVLALLDACEDGGFSGWKPDQAVFSAANVRAPSAGTWEVLLVNLGHPEARDARAWLAHGVGYRLLGAVANRLLACGAFGAVPPWLQQGLADELDIAAYGQAWVAGAESTESSWSQGGWRKTGWEGFLPEGAVPPPPVYTPPPPMTVKLQKHVSDDGWIARDDSATRHWSRLAADLGGDAPPSLQRAAVAREHSPRDRAYGRLVLHLVLQPQGRAAGTPDLLAALDSKPAPVLGGVRPGEPLTAVVARALGGVPELDALEAETLERQLVAAGRPEVIDELRQLGAGTLLALRDHREQSAWLYRQLQYDTRRRQRIFDIIVQSEQLQQLREWEVLGAALDRGAQAALAGRGSYPKGADKLDDALQAFREALTSPSKPGADG
jgi:hypothetical protein